MNKYHRSFRNVAKLSKEEVRNFIDSFDTVVTDCDGVLWLGNSVLGRASLVMNRLRDLGKQIFFVTNNSTKSRDEFVAKAKKMGFISNREEVLTSSYLAVNYLKAKKFNRKVYVLGSKGLTHELDLIGIKHIGSGPDVVQSDLESLVRNIELDFEVGAVIVGFDMHMSYPKILKAASYLKDPECLFIATNPDVTFPMKTSLTVPGTGSILQSVSACAERKPFIVGKPYPYIAEMLVSQIKVDPRKTLMIGDRANTDILLGRRCGFYTLLVLTGITTLEDVHKWQDSQKEEHLQLVPDLYLEKLEDLLPFIK